MTRNRTVVRATASRSVPCRVALAAMAIAAIAAAAACEPASQAAASFFSQSCLLDTMSVACEDCIRAEVETRLGEDEEGAGYLGDLGTGAIVRDATGSYWVSQREHAKVFDASGSFQHAVGRAGRGPLEFSVAEPLHTDRNGNVHVFDQWNRRVHVITDSLTLAEMKPLPASMIESKVALADGDLYAVAAWIPTPDHIGFPVHVVGKDGAVTMSFGVVKDSAGSEQVVDEFTARRWLAADADDNVFSAKHYDYVVEAWAEDGSRIGWLEGRALDDGSPRKVGPWAEDHPPWHQIRSIHADADGYLWVVLWYRRPGWFEAMEEVVLPSGGQPFLRPKDGTLSSYYHSRIDVVDLDRCAVVATTWYDGVLMQFVEDGLLSELDYGPLAQPVVNILNISLARAADGARVGGQNGAMLALHTSRR